MSEKVNSSDLGVLVLMPTYNHENFIEEAIHGVLNQDCKFPVHLYISDDCSKDNTLLLAKDFKSRGNISIIINKEIENLGAYKNGEKLRNYAFASKFKYIAICEGDDCWNDPFKLQKQVDFLEGHKDYVISFHEVEKIDPSGDPLNQFVLGEKRRQDLSQEKLIEGELVPTVAAVFRREFLSEFLSIKILVKNADTFLFAILGQYGKAHFHADIQPAKYRIHEGGIWTGIDIKSKKEALIHTFETLKKVIKSEKKQIVNNVLFDKYLDQFLNLDYPLVTKIKLYFRLWGFSASNGLVGYLFKLHLQFVSKFGKKIIHG